MPSSVTLPVGSTIQVAYTTTLSGSGPPPSTTGATWTTSDATKVAFRTSDGNPVLSTVASDSAGATALAAGTATLTVTLGAFTDTITVTVSSNPEVNITGITATHNP